MLTRLFVLESNGMWLCLLDDPTLSIYHYRCAAKFCAHAERRAGVVGRNSIEGNCQTGRG
jgi:hypothetical protein